MQTFRLAAVRLLPQLLLIFSSWGGCAFAAAAKVHTVVLGAARKVPSTPAETTPDSKADDTAMLRVRPLLVDGRQKEWTTGDAHDITDRSFTVRRMLRVNDALPGESAARYVWQPGPWLLVDRVTGHVTALHLPDFDPAISEVAWFRDYAAYCGIGTTAKGGLFAVVAQVGVRRAVVHSQLAKWPQPEHARPVCLPARWQRTPIRATLHATGGEPVTFDIVGTTALVEEGDGDDPQ